MGKMIIIYFFNALIKDKMCRSFIFKCYLLRLKDRQKKKTVKGHQIEIRVE